MPPIQFLFFFIPTTQPFSQSFQSLLNHATGPHHSLHWWHVVNEVSEASSEHALIALCSTCALLLFSVHHTMPFSNTSLPFTTPHSTRVLHWSCNLHFNAPPYYFFTSQSVVPHSILCYCFSSLPPSGVCHSLFSFFYVLCFMSYTEWSMFSFLL